MLHQRTRGINRSECLCWPIPASVRIIVALLTRSHRAGNDLVVQCDYDLNDAAVDDGTCCSGTCTKLATGETCPTPECDSCTACEVCEEGKCVAVGAVPLSST